MGQCKYCGSEVKEGMRFCGNCGALQEAAEPEVKAETTGEPAPTAAEESAVMPVEENAAAAAGENAVTGTEEKAAAGQEAPGETAKRKPRRLRAALFAAAAVAVAAVGAAVLVHRMTAMTGERFVRVQAEALRQEAAPFEGLGAVFENGFSSDFVLSMQMSRSRLLAISRSGDEDYILIAKALQRGIQAKVDFGRHLETAVLNLEVGTDDSAKLNFDCFLDSEKFGYRIPQVGEQVFVLNYPEALPSKELLSASAARYGRVLAAAVKPKEIEVKKRAYTARVLKRQLNHEMKGEYMVYTWKPDRETLETLFRSLAAEMREDKDFADW